MQLVVGLIDFKRKQIRGLAMAKEEFADQFASKCNLLFLIQSNLLEYQDFMTYRRMINCRHLLLGWFGFEVNAFNLESEVF